MSPVYFIKGNDLQAVRLCKKILLYEAFIMFQYKINLYIFRIGDIQLQYLQDMYLYYCGIPCGFVEAYPLQLM